VTLAGSSETLDARLARSLCSAHGVPHEVIHLGEDYLRQLPDLATSSSALTGGPSSLSQTIDLYLYGQLPRSTRVRISGNLGNQVGRGGVESLSAARPDAEVLGSPLRSLLAQRPAEPWFIGRMSNGRFGDVLFAQEVHFWSISNYVIGSHHALQVSPYSDTRLIELAKARFLADPEFRNVSWKLLRQRDMRHRLMGQPVSQSFQRAFLAREDRAGEDVPINWGWLPGGGWSPSWSLATLKSAADAAALKAARKSPRFEKHLRWISTRLGRPSALVAWPDVLKSHLRDLSYDTLRSTTVRQSGLLEPLPMNRLLDDHFSGRKSSHSTIFSLLDISLGIAARSRLSA